MTKKEMVDEIIILGYGMDPSSVGKAVYNRLMACSKEQITESYDMALLGAGAYAVNRLLEK